MQKGCLGSKTQIREFRIEDLHVFEDLIEKLPMRGNESVRRNPSAPIVVATGQDESVHCPHALKPTC